jgi:hypothetical protein
MNQMGYEKAFWRYERALASYERLQAEIHSFLMRFTGELELDEKPFVLMDLARMEGLRMQRDDSYTLFRATEEAIFDRLGKPWDAPSDSGEALASDD